MMSRAGCGVLLPRPKGAGSRYSTVTSFVPACWLSWRGGSNLPGVNREVVMAFFQRLLGVLVLLAGVLGMGLAEEPRAPEPAPAGTDRYGDPLPAEALARMGTVRWRHGGQVTEVAFID